MRQIIPPAYFRVLELFALSRDSGEAVLQVIKVDGASVSHQRGAGRIGSSFARSCFSCLLTRQIILVLRLMLTVERRNNLVGLVPKS